MTNTGAFLALHKHLKGEGECGLRREEIEEAVSEMLRRAKIVDLNEYIRSYKYRRIGPTGRVQQLVAGSRGWREWGCGVFRGSRELLGHSGQIERLCFDQGSRFFISGSGDGMIKLWDVETGFLVHSFIGHRSLVNDLCVSSDGRMLVSCDFFGLLNVWSLESFKILFQLRLGCEIIFAEFFDTGGVQGYNLVVVLAKGVVKTYKLGDSGVVSEEENLCLVDEAIKGLCFTDGGRFLLCGGWWPFLVVFDMEKPGGCIVLETNGGCVSTMCGAKRGLKIAAACESQVYQWTFFAEGSAGMGNFKRRTKDTTLEGHWRRSIVKVEMEENEGIERICYLKDNFLVCVCTDLKIRIFAGTELRCVIESQEMGVVYPHPLENMFAFCGSHLRIYRMEELVHEEVLNFSVNDGQFSNDGEFLILGDERGVVKVISMNFLGWSPKEQFFMSDFEHINSMNEGGFVECRKEGTFNINRDRNEEWRAVEYVGSRSSNVCMRIEELGARHLCKDFVPLEVFRRKYMKIPLPGEIRLEDVEGESGDNTASVVLESSSSGESGTSTEEEIEDRVEEMASTVVRRFLIESESEIEDRRMPVLRRDVVSDDESSDGNRDMNSDEYGLLRKLRRFNRPEDGVDEEAGIRESDVGYVCRSSSISSLISRSTELVTAVGSRSHGGREEIRRGNGLSPSSSQALVHNEIELTKYVQSWLSSAGLVPQVGDMVYFSEEAHREFQRFDTRSRFKSQTRASGYYEVKDMEIAKYEPPFVKVTLWRRGASFTIRYYRYPGSPPVLLLKEQMGVGVGDSVGFVLNHVVTRGGVVDVQGSSVVVRLGDSQVVVDRSDVLVFRNIFAEDTKQNVLGLLKQKRAYRNLYVTLRRESNTLYYENIASNINLGVIEEKVVHDLYRTVEGLEFDLDVVAGNSFYLGPVFHRYCKQVVESIKSAIEGM